jgi:hypothetical protein
LTGADAQNVRIVVVALIRPTYGLGAARQGEIFCDASDALFVACQLE